MRHATVASRSSQLSSHTVPQTLFIITSKRPTVKLFPPTRRACCIPEKIIDQTPFAQKYYNTGKKCDL